MVFIHIPRDQSAVAPSREEVELLDELERRGVPPQDFEAALVARGVPPERARLLAKLGGPRSTADRARAIAGAVFWVLVALVVGIGERPLRRWVREEYPGMEWLVGLILPAVVLVAFLWTLAARLRAARQASDGVTHADQIENKPIG